MKFLIVLFVIANPSISRGSDSNVFSTTAVLENESTTFIADEETTSIPDINRFLFYKPKPFLNKPLFHNTPDQLSSCTVGIYYEGKHICSGFLWSEWYILTTADCISGLADSNGIQIIIGDSHNVIHRVSVVRYHRNYKSDPDAYDVAIMKTCLPVVKPKKNCIIAVSTERNLCNNLPVKLKTEPFNQIDEVEFELIPKGNDSICISPTRNSCCLKEIGSSIDCYWDQGGPLFSTETNVHGLITSNPENNCNKDSVQILAFTEEILYWVRQFSSSFKVFRCMKFFRGSPIEAF